MLKLYAYQGCSTCRNAVKWLKQHGVSFEEIPIREQPPTTLELQAALKSRDGDPGSLFNRSGQDYRALGMKEKLPAMSQPEALQLLSQNGNLVKRPFAIDEKKRVVLVGFKEPEWEAALRMWGSGYQIRSRNRRDKRLPTEIIAGCPNSGTAWFGPQLFLDKPSSCSNLHDGFTPPPPNE